MRTRCLRCNVSARRGVDDGFRLDPNTNTRNRPSTLGGGQRVLEIGGLTGAGAAGVVRDTNTNVRR